MSDEKALLIEATALVEQWQRREANGWTANVIQRLIAEVERLTAERDRARELAVALEQQAGEALRLVNETLERAPGFGEWVFRTYLRDISRLLGVPDDEEENQP